MNVMPSHFNIIQIFGFWCPLEWSSSWKSNLYWLYTSVVMSLMITLLFTQIMYIVQYIDDVEEIASIAFLLLTELCTFCKVLNILRRRSDIIDFMNILTNDRCRPNSAEEITIQDKFNRRIRRTSLIFGGMVESFVVYLTVVTLFVNIPERTLPFNAWIPFNYSTSLGFWIAFLHQMITYSYFVNATMSTAFDTLVPGLMCQACAQLNILKYRLKLIPSAMPDKTSCKNTSVGKNVVEDAANKALGKCIRHHLDIFEFTKLLNDTFDGVLLLQCTISTFVLCVSVFMLARTKLFTSEFVLLAAYIVCMLVQIYVMCWYGNELIVESTDVGNAVYEMDWTNLNVQTQKSLTIVMARTLHPTTFTSGHIITLYLDTFIKLIKLSYSMFNLLDKTT